MAGSGPSDAPHSPAEEARLHAEDRAGASPARIGAAAVYSGFQNGEHVWDCIVTDRSEWRYVQVLGSDLGPYPGLSAEDVEQGVEGFAAMLPSENRLRQLLNANPLHIDRQGTVRD